MRRMLATTAAMMLALGAVGCSKEIGAKAISKEKLAGSVKSQLAKTVGQEPKSVTCAKELEAKVGAKVRCILTADDGSKIGLTVTTTKVKGTDVGFHIEVDQHVMGSGS